VADFAQARETMDNDRALFEELAQMCLNDVPAQLEQLRQGHAMGNCRHVSECAHAIKGMVSMFGAERTVSTAVQLEQLANEGLPPASALAELEAAIDDFSQALANYRW
jgi:HPt (histidine-containing phosphotransfer) domain-containing protein